jgi:hypothetical protein
LVALLTLPCSCARDESSDKARLARAAASPTKARLRPLSGEVRLKRALGDEWIRAVKPTELLANDKVRTLGGGSALIEFANGSVVTLGEDALIGIAETLPRPGQDRSDLTLVRGRLDAELDDPAKQSLSINTLSVTVRAGREIVFQ